MGIISGYLVMNTEFIWTQLAARAGQLDLYKAGEIVKGKSVYNVWSSKTRTRTGDHSRKILLCLPPPITGYGTPSWHRDVFKLPQNIILPSRKPSRNTSRNPSRDANKGHRPEGLVFHQTIST